MSQAGSSGANGGGGSSNIKTITGNTGGAESPLANNFDIVGTGSITVAGSAHTETVQLTGLTTHNVLVGAGSATITKVAPSATSGIPLVSGGSSADPSFTTAVVAGGGTGIVTTTAYAPICGGTTATGNFQAADTGISNIGYVLTSAGSSSLPTWQSASGGGITTIDGDTGSVTGSTVTFTGESTAGATVIFSGSGTTMSFDVSDTTNLNTYIGNAAGAAFVSGSQYNTGVGCSALHSVSGGAFNTAVGWDSSSSITSADHNCSFGSASLHLLSTGTYNSAFGAYSLEIFDGDNNNTALGAYAMVAATGGTANTATGSGALGAISTGSYNVGIGRLAGYSYTGAESSNICINSEGVLGESNTLRIGAGTGTSAYQINAAYIAGIYGTSLSGSSVVVTSSGQLGVGSGGGGITTIDGDVSSITGSTVSLLANTGSANCGASVFFNAASGTELDLVVTDSKNNTFIGESSGSVPTQNSGHNTGIGSGSLGSLNGNPIFTQASNNTALGAQSGGGLTTGSSNVALGDQALLSETSGSRNIAIGVQSLKSGNGGSRNIGLGVQVGNNYTGTESNNILIGSGNTDVNGENNVLRIGANTGTGSDQINAAYISGINGIVVTGVPVLVSSGDQLGVASSSRKFKKDIKDMSEESSPIMNLRPVTFVWDRDSAPGLKDATNDRQFGFIAEEAAKIVPSLVNYSKEGEIVGFKYNELPAILLNELQKALKRIEVLEEKLK